MKNMNKALVAGMASAVAVFGPSVASAMADCNTVGPGFLQTADESILTNTPFNSLTLDPPSPEATLEVQNVNWTISINNPLVRECRDRRIVGYLGRYDGDTMVEISGKYAHLTEYIGGRAIHIPHSQAASFVANRSVWPTPANSNTTLEGFTDGTTTYGDMP